MVVVKIWTILVVGGFKRMKSIMKRIMNIGIVLLLIINTIHFDAVKAEEGLTYNEKTFQVALTQEVVDNLPRVE